MSDPILNLDDLFGQSRPVKIIYKGKDYELVRPEALSPNQYNDWINLQKRVDAIKAKSDGLTDAEFQEWDGLLSEVLGLLCPAFVEDQPPFQVRAKTLEFYFQTVFKDLRVEGKAAAKN